MTTCTQEDIDMNIKKLEESIVEILTNRAKLLMEKWKVENILEEIESNIDKSDTKIFEIKNTIEIYKDQKKTLAADEYEKSRICYNTVSEWSRLNDTTKMLVDQIGCRINLLEKTDFIELPIKKYILFDRSGGKMYGNVAERLVSKELKRVFGEKFEGSIVPNEDVDGIIRKMNGDEDIIRALNKLYENYSDNNDRCIYHPKINFGGKCAYPDFKIGNTIIELKYVVEISIFGSIERARNQAFIYACLMQYNDGKPIYDKRVIEFIEVWNVRESQGTRRIFSLGMFSIGEMIWIGHAFLDKNLHIINYEL